MFAGANEKQNQDSVISRVLIDSNTGKMDLDSAIKTDKDNPDWLNSKYACTEKHCYINCVTTYLTILDSAIQCIY